MHSRGIKIRTINHSIIQDGYELQIKLKQRRWRCTNPQCKYETNENFKFVDKQKRNTNATDMIIINAFRNLNESAVSIANQFHVSDTYVLETFSKCVKLDRLPLSDIISVDKVFLDMDEYCKYAVVDSFHAIQWILHKIDMYIRTLIREFKQRDRIEYQQRHPYEEIPKILSSPKIPLANSL